MWRLVPSLTREMGQAYPELLRAEALITETLKLEETRFRRTLERGLVILDEKSKGLQKGAMFDGDTAFTLYDTYGFPLDLTQDALRARGISVDLASFTDAMERQREKARASWSGSGDTAQETVWFALREKIGATEFLGYETESAEGVVAALVKDGKEVSELKKGESGAVVMNQTPFYGESGGQVGDTGMMRRDGLKLTVSDTQKKAGDLFAHLVKVEQGTVKIGDPLLLEVDHGRRSGIRQNHSATHLLHEALRRVLGDHVAQKGSLVAPDRLRFDFSHPKPMSADEIERVEDIANDIVLQNAPVTTRLMAQDDAIASGARALFGEKYGDEVRVVAMGEGTGNTLGWSVELCGGTHVGRTGDIGLISVVSESGVAAGCPPPRGVDQEKPPARPLINSFKSLKRRLRSLRFRLKTCPDVSGLSWTNAKSWSVSSPTPRRSWRWGVVRPQGALREKVTEIQGVKVVAKELTGVKFSDLRSIADNYKKQLGSGVVILSTSSEDGKVSLVVGVTSDLTSSNNAVEMVKVGVPLIGGSGGGGRPDMAQGVRDQSRRVNKSV